MNRIFSSVAWLSGVALAAGALGAQPEVGPASKRPYPLARLKVEFATAADADFDGAAGSMSLRTAVAEIGSMFPLIQGTLIGPAISYRNTRVDFDDFVLGGMRTSPFDAIHESSFGLQLRQRLGDRWGLFAIGGFTNAITDGADFNDGWKPRLLAVANYRASDTFTFGFGAGGTYDLDDKLRAFPVISIDWRPTARWRVAIRNDVSVSYLLHEPSSLRVGLSATFAGRFGGRTFRLSERGPLPDGIGEIEAQVVGLDVRIEPNPSIALRALLGAVTKYELTLRNRREVRVFDEKLDAAPFLGLEATIQF